MRWDSSFRRTFMGASALFALAILSPGLLVASEWLCRENDDYCAEINGEVAPDARFFLPIDPEDRMVVDFPSLSVSAVINLQTRKVVTVPRSSLNLEEKVEGVVRVSVIIPAYAPNSALLREKGDYLSSFQLGNAVVHVQKASKCRPPDPIPTMPPAGDDPSARKCLIRDTRPIQATAGCTKAAFLRNTCGQPVYAAVRSTQHLLSGTLPQTSTLMLAPGAEVSLGCVWMSGAMAPTDYDVVAASFPQKPSSSDGQAHGSTRH